MDLLAPEFTPKRTFLEMIRRIPQTQGASRTSSAEG